MSKGSKRRPQQIDEDEMERRWQMAFGPKPKRTWSEVFMIAQHELGDYWDDVRRECPHLFAPYDETTAEHALNSHRKGD